MPICFMLFVHCARRAASRAACTAGKRSAIKTAMIAITTSNSIRVKPAERLDLFIRCTFLFRPIRQREGGSKKHVIERHARKSVDVVEPDQASARVNPTERAQRAMWDLRVTEE